MKVKTGQWLAIAGFGCVLSTAVVAATVPNLFPFPDKTGFVSTYVSKGSFNESGPFFRSLGTNGRTCATCHVVSNAMGLSAAHAEQVYEATNGRDPLFSAVDGAVCPTAAPEQNLNFSLLRQKGLIRIGLTMPSNPQFTLRVVEDPYGCALVTDSQGGANDFCVPATVAGDEPGFHDFGNVGWAGDGRATEQPGDVRGELVHGFVAPSDGCNARARAGNESAKRRTAETHRGLRRGARFGAGD